MTNAIRYNHTLKEYYDLISALVDTARQEGFGLPEGYTYEGIQTFLDKRVELLDSKLEGQRQRNAKKRNGNEMREAILRIIDSDEFKTVATIAHELSEMGHQATNRQVISYLNQFGERGTNQVEKSKAKARDSQGRSIKVVSFRLKKEV